MKHLSFKTIALQVAVVLAGGIVLQGFQCSSSGATSAKQYITKAEQAANQLQFTGAKMDAAKKQKTEKDKTDNYRKAIDVLTAEVRLNPNNGEAWHLLGKSYMGLGGNDNTDSVVIAFTKSLQLNTDTTNKQVKPMREEAGGMLYQTWGGYFNDAVKEFNEAPAQASDAAKTAKFNSALRNAQKAIQLKPENYDVYQIVALVYENIGKGDDAIATFEQSYNLQKPATDFLVSKQVAIGTNREDAIAALGAPISSKGVQQEPDSCILDRYKVGSNEYYVFNPKNRETGKFTLQGIKANPPASWMPYERERFVSFDTRSLSYIAYKNYEKKNYDKSLEQIELALALDPANENAMNIQNEILRESGKADQAAAKVAQMVQKFPNNAGYRVQYAGVLLTQKKWQDAINQYDEALKLDPKNEIALFNSGAAYKNKAGDIQREEFEKRDRADEARKKDPKNKNLKEYVVDDKRYMSDLEKSAEYFNRLRSLPGKDRDIALIENLINIYGVIGKPKEGEKRRLIAELNAYEGLNADKPDYWEAMQRIYASEAKAIPSDYPSKERLKQKADYNKKAMDALQKADALRKK